MNLRRRVAAVIGLLLMAWVVSPAVLPLYDGPTNPDETYRYVAPPAGWPKTPAPTTASSSIPVRGGVSTAAYVTSGEQGPQVIVYVPAGSLRAPGGASAIRVSAAPSAPKAPLPSDGRIVSNVYTITATAPEGSVDPIGKGENQLPVLQMRAPNANQPGPTFETFDGKKWKSAETIRVAQDVYQTFAPKLGVWALVQQQSGGGGSRGSGVNLALLIPGIVILVLVGIILLVRLTRSRGPTPPAKRTPARR